MSKQMLELADSLAARLNGRCVTIGPGLREEVEAAVAALRLSAESAPVTHGSLKPGDRLSYVLDEGTKIGRITAHTRPIEPAPDTPPQAYAVSEPVADTWLVGGRPDLMAMSGDVESDRVIKLHFRRPATDQDRKWLLEAINAKLAGTEPQASVMRSAAARWLDKPEVKAALHRRPSGTEPQASADSVQPPPPAWIDAAALQAAHEIVALSESWTYARRKAAIQVIVAREMMRAHPARTEPQAASPPLAWRWRRKNDVAGFGDWHVTTDRPKGEVYDLTPLLAAAQSQAVNVERCTTCGRTDAEYAGRDWTCTNPWHADAHLRRKIAPLTRPHREEDGN